MSLILFRKNLKKKKKSAAIGNTEHGSGGRGRSGHNSISGVKKHSGVFLIRCDKLGKVGWSKGRTSREVKDLSGCSSLKISFDCV